MEQTAEKRLAQEKIGFSKLSKEVAMLAADRNIQSMIKQRIEEFERLRNKGTDADWFSEMCFCIMTANSTARLGIELQKTLGDGCITLSQSNVEAILRTGGHRFARPRANYICRARAHQNLKAIIESFPDDASAREWLVENISGLGYKEASHFLRNTGHFGVAILDRHILRLMKEYSLIPAIPKTLTRKRYLEIEKALSRLAETVGMPLGVLDFYLWFMRTGEILK